MLSAWLLLSAALLQAQTAPAAAPQAEPLAPPSTSTPAPVPASAPATQATVGDGGTGAATAAPAAQADSGAAPAATAPTAPAAQAAPATASSGSGEAGDAAQPSSTSPGARDKERGDYLASAGQLEEALKAYDAAIILDSALTDAYNQKGVALVKLGRMEDAVAAFDKALALDNGFTTAIYNRGFALKKLERTDDVIQAFARYVSLLPEDADGYFQLAEGQYVKGLFEAAKDNYEKYLSLETMKGKKATHAKKRVAELKERLGGASAAEAKAAGVNEIHNIPPTSVLYITPERDALCQAKTAEGISLRSEGKNRDAVTAHQDAVNANPFDLQALFQLGESYAAMDYFLQAATRWEKILQADPSPALKGQTVQRLENAYKEMERRGMGKDGKPLSEQGEATSADDSAEKTPSGVPIDPKAREASMKGASLFADGKYAEAIEQYDIALAFHPDVAEYYSARGSAWLATNDATRAMADFSKAHSYDAAAALPLYGMGEASFILGKLTDAKEHFSACLASTAGDATESLRKRAQDRLDQIDKKQAAGPQMKFDGK